MVDSHTNPRPSKPVLTTLFRTGLLLALTLSLTGAVRSQAARGDDGFLDLSLLVAPELPCTWPHPQFPYFQITHQRRIGPASAYNVDTLLMDGNTATQIDVPPHSVLRPELNRPKAGPYGDMYIDKTPAWQFGGEACVIELRELLDQAPNGDSPLIEPEHVKAWEAKNRPLRFGDVVLFHTGYTDKYYKPFPAGHRFIALPAAGLTPAWPAPSPACMEYLGERGVMTAGCDSPSMGPMPDLAEPTHYAGLKYGMIWTEAATGLAQLPTTGAFFCMIGPKHAGAPYGEGRVFAIVDEKLAARLIESARRKRAVDLTVTLSMDLPITWPGYGPGNHRQAYYKVDFMYDADRDFQHHTHLFDSQAGTHLVPPAYALPPKGFDNDDYAPEVQEWLADYEQEYGRRGTSSVTTEQVPISQTSGRARVIDVRRLVGTTDEDAWPASPEITVDHIKAYENRHGELEPGDVVVFHSDHSDKYFEANAAGDACMVHPLEGKSEGWPSPGPDAIIYLADKGIRCVATDGPRLGGVDPRRALMTYWALGSRGMVGVEYLTHVGQMPEGAYFIFAAVKVKDCHGGPGRAIAYY